MTRYHVEYEFEGKPAERNVRKGWTTYDLAETTDAGGFHLMNSFPPDAVITEIPPEPEAGWYQYEGDDGDVVLWTSQEIEDYGSVQFFEYHRRVHPPVPWVDNSSIEEDSKYTDGYYFADTGSQYRRLDGVWMLKPSDYDGPWIRSIFNDSDIESPDSGFTFIPED